jgi:O-6-methylguanine DNA methyltransferase
MYKNDKTFTVRVQNVVRAIPRGSVTTYKEVARKAGNPKAARAVANIMAKNFDPDIPCHRVIHSNGAIGSYNRGGTEAKRALLITEGALASETDL